MGQRTCALLGCLLLASTGGQAAVKLPSLISDNMLLQADRPVPIWGTAAAGERVTVEFAGQTAAATADADGTWRVELPALKAGTAGTLSVNGANRIEVKNVLVGALWVSAGQSNAGMGMKLMADADAAIAAANFPRIRLFDVKGHSATTPQSDVVGSWVECSPEALRSHGQWGGFPAVACLFARDLHQSTGQPVGIIASAYGGTPAESWTSLAGLRQEPALGHYVQEFEQLPKRMAQYARRQTRYQLQLAAWRKEAKQDPDLPEPPAPGPAPDQDAHVPTTLFNGMVAPLTKAAVEGVIWYQGETYSGPAPEYRVLFPALIRSWRQAWGRDDLPFVFVQLPNFDVNYNWAFTREGQAAALALPRTAMAVAIDAGDPRDVHVPNKQVIAHRLALAALRLVYGRDIVASGPLYAAMKVEGARIRVSFREAAGLKIGALGPQPGLPTRSRADRLTGFAIAGADQQFQPAEATIDGDSVVVASDRVPQPVAVRYGWADNPDCNLYNAADLPAAPFRTDTWQSEWSAVAAPPPPPTPGPATSGVVNMHLAISYANPDTKVPAGTLAAAPDAGRRVWNNVLVPGGNGFLMPTTRATGLVDSNGGATAISLAVSGRNQSWRSDNANPNPVLVSYPGAGRYSAVLDGLDGSGQTVYDLYVYNYWFTGGKGALTATTSLVEGTVAGDTERDNVWDPASEKYAHRFREGVNYVLFGAVRPTAGGRIIVDSQSAGGALNSLQLVARPAVRTALLNACEDVATVGTRQSRVALTDQHATEGGHGFEANFDVADYPNISFDAGRGFTVTDWKPYGALLFDAYNPDEQPLPLSFRLDDRAGHNWSTSVELPSRKQVRVALVLHLPDSGMKGYPLAAAVGADLGGYFWQTPLDLGDVATFQFFLATPKSPRRLVLDNIQLTQIPALSRIVDRYGQFTMADWPGKIHEDGELVAQHAAEDEALRKAPALPDRDPWGGWSAGPQLPATGWFHTVQRDGRWWLVTPGGRLFWSVGLDCVGPDQSCAVKGHEELFAWRPEPDDPLYAFGWRGGWVNFWGMNLQRKFGLAWEKAWLDLTRRRMTAWGFNTVGNWSQDKACRELRLPFTVPIHYDRVKPFAGGDGDICDFWDDAWRQAVEARIKSVAAQWAEDPYCLGYFVDNELPWGRADAFAAGALALTGERAVKREVTAAMQRKYPDIAALNAAWGTAVASWEAFAAQPVRLPDKRTEACRADSSELLSAFAQHYFATVAELLRRHAPHQLYLGSRFSAVPPDEVALAAGKSCDVVSYNIYGGRDTLLSRGTQIARLGRPVLIGEFHFGALDRGMFHGGMVPVASQQARGERYAEYIQTALDQPWCVGAHWFTYGDEALTGRGDGENFNIGFVSVADVPYPELVSRATAANAAVYQRRARQ